MSVSMENLSFGNIFEDIFTNLKLSKEIKFADKLKKRSNFQQQLETENDIGSILNLIASCLEYEPSKRPSLLAIEKSQLLDLDAYASLNARKFAQIMIFYKSPSLNICERVFNPLRMLCTRTIKNPRFILKAYSEITRLINFVSECISPIDPQTLESLKKDAMKVNKFSEVQ